MRCASCGRGLLRPFYTAPAGLGGYMLGPKCAAAAGKVRPGKRKGRKPAVVHEVQPGQLDMFHTAESVAKNAP